MMKYSRQSGFTMIEMVIVAAIFAIVMNSAVTTMRSGQKSFEQSVSSTVLSSRANRVLNRIARRMTSGGSSVLDQLDSAPLSEDSVTFQDIQGFSNGAPIWSDDVQILLEYDEGETDNDIDDDGDGLIDECRIVQVESGTGGDQRVVIAKSVAEFLEGEEPNLADDNGNGLEDERGLCFTRQNNTVIIRVSLQRVDVNGAVDTRTVQTSVALRN